MSDQLLFQRLTDERDGVVDAELGEQALAVPVDGLGAEVQLGGNLGVGHAVADEAEDALLDGGEADGLCGSLAEDGLGLGADVAASLPDADDGFEERVDG